MKFKMRGTTLQVLDVELNKGESMFTESGGMAWMSPNMSMVTNTRGGLLKGIARKFAGESLFLTTYTCDEGTGTISFNNEFPGKIMKFDLKENKPITCQKDAFLCATSEAKLEATFHKKIGAGFFGGEGFILQKLTGPGTAFIELDGEVTEYNLKKGQQLKVSIGHIGAFEDTVEYSIARVKGVKNMFFSGEGIFLATLTGPGKVWLQSMPIKNLARKLQKYMVKKH